MSKISVVINTLNEEKNLPRALASIKDFADEVIVVDMYSDDDTVTVAKKAGAQVFEHKRMGYVEPARNFAIEKANSEWILILDADEEVTKKLSGVLKRIAGDSKSADYYRLPRKNIIFGKWIKHARWWPDYNVRFFKKGHVVWSEIIHSIPVTFGKGADLDAGEDNSIVHYNYGTIEQYIDRLNRYTTHQVPQILKSGYKFSWTDLLTEPTQEFVSRYFQGEGYKDGVHGLVLSLLQAFSELVLYLKVWQTQKFESNQISVRNAISEIKKSQKEINYWAADTLLKEKNSLIQTIKRKFRIL